MRYEQLAEFDTELTADVVAWRPGALNSLVCGTYYLNKEINQREGRLYVLQFNDQQLSTTHTRNYTSSGLLDLTWLDNDHLLTIDSNNQLELLRCGDLDELSSVTQLKLSDPTAIGLTLDVDTKTRSVLTGDSKGNLNLLRLEENTFRPIVALPAHGYEVWSVHLDRIDANLIYSGADDSQLKLWDLRDHQKATTTWSLFGGGVCSILTPQRSGTYLACYSEHQVVCSSYDEKIYVLDKRNSKRSINESKKLDGGVWKMKLHPSLDLLLCACMHAGVHIVEIAKLTSQLFYAEHGVDTLAYGCDWGSRDKDGYLIATCSFYNHMLRIWRMIE